MSQLQLAKVVGTAPTQVSLYAHPMTVLTVDRADTSATTLAINDTALVAILSGFVVLVAKVE